MSKNQTYPPPHTVLQDSVGVEFHTIERDTSTRKKRHTTVSVALCVSTIISFTHRHATHATRTTNQPQHRILYICSFSISINILEILATILRLQVEMPLKGIPHTITPELLFAMARMGHGDKLCIADANFPSDSVAKHSG